MRLPAMGDFVCLECHKLEAIKLPQGGHPVTDLASKGCFVDQADELFSFQEFPPNACRGERCGVWGRIAPINLVYKR